MKRFKTTIIVLLTVISMSKSVFAQNENVSIAFSDPEDRGSLVINVIDSYIDIEGYSGNEVKVTIVDNRRRVDQSRSQDLRLFLDFEEEGNEIRIDARGKRTRQVDLKIQVPYNTWLRVKTIYGDYIKVKDVKGSIEVETHSGDIDVINGEGSALVYSAKGDINVELKALSLEYPSAISNVYGDIRLSIPGDSKATMKIDSYSKELDTEFEMTLDVSQSSRNKRIRESISDNLSSSVDRRAVMRRVDNFLDSRGAHMTINGGGALVRLKTHSGKIALRKLN